MDELSAGAVMPGITVQANGKQDIHRDYLMSKLPASMKDVSVMQRVSTIDSIPHSPEWYMASSAMDRQYLETLINERRRHQGLLEETVEHLQQDIHGFARPLLVQALKEQLNLELDVDATLIRLYIPAQLGWVIDNNASRFRQSSLLEAALHNFEEPETQAGAFRDGSGIFIDDGEGGLQRLALTVERFAALCRTLDIGALYQRHIKALLAPEGIEAKAKVEQQSIAIEKAAFSEAALIAYLKKDITSMGYSTLQQVRNSTPGIMLGNRPLQCHRLSLMGFKLTGIVLFSAVADPSIIKSIYESLLPPLQQVMLDWARRLSILPGQEFEQFKLLKAFFANGPSAFVEETLRQDDIDQQTRLDGTLIVYVPDDPHHPFKEYESFTDFMKELTSQLRSPDYQQFFSRFVAQKDKGKFFARVRERLTTFAWKQREPLDMGPWWRETAIENADAEPVTNVIAGDLWPQIGRWRREKACADARKIAVPTGDEDVATRWNRLSSYLDIGWNVFSFGAMLIPGVGEAIVAVMVGQMLFETMEGIEEWSKGDRDEAAAHLTGVMINAAQLAIMMAGHVLPGGAPVPVKPSSFIDRLQRVELPDGQPRLWNGDLKPYAQDIALPEAVKPGEQGLYRYGGKDLLKHENRHFEVKLDPHTGQPRLQHPTRPGAYQPSLEHNGAGAWKTELDQPVHWDKTRLMRRLGPTVEGFSDATLEHIRIASGVEENALRRLHVVSDPPPALLTHLIERFNAWAEVQKLPGQILANEVPQAFVDQVPRLLTELPRWPQQKGIEVFEGRDHSGPSTRYGNINATQSDTLKVTRAEVQAGKLPERVVRFANESDLHAMLGQAISTDRQVRIDTLKSRLAEQAGKQRERLFNEFDRQRQDTSDPRVRVLQDAHKTLPSTLAKELLSGIDFDDLLKITEPSRIPLQLGEQVRMALRELRTARAYEGLFLDSANVDSERLALHSVQALPNWPENVRIEIREDSFDGPLRDSIGADTAVIRKILVRRHDQFEAYDAEGHHLHGKDDLYASVLHALPDAERNTLGFHINQGAALKHAIHQAPLPRDTVNALLADDPIHKPDYDPATMKLPAGMPAAVPGLAQVRGQMTPMDRVRFIRPGWTENEALAYLGSGENIEKKASDLEAEFNKLNANFQRWLKSPTQSYRFLPAGIAEWKSRNALYKAIRECWQLAGQRDVDSFGRVHGAVLDLRNMPLGAHLGGMPPLEGNFNHVTRLNVQGTALIDAQASFLDHFPHLRSLNLMDNSLTRLPQVVGRMRKLTELSLRGNRIVLDTPSVKRLSRLSQLETLDLHGNPLGQVPNIGQMRRLHTLLLADTGIRTWPSGLFAQPRSRLFYLDMQRNIITSIPPVAPGSVQAELLARTVLSMDPQWLPELNRETLRQYIQSVGMDPDRPYPPRGVRDSLDWEEGLTRPEWVAKQEIWNAVEDEFGSEPFFNQIRKLTQSTAFKNDLGFRVDMTGKVWRMLEAMSKDSALRRNLFVMGKDEVTTCVDSGAQLFNAMGVEVLIHEAYALANPSLVEADLVTLARGKSRLDELSRIAHKSIAERLEKGETFWIVDPETGQVRGSIDEVETHHGFMTDLADRLDLPWQSRDMQFRADSSVTPTMIENAYRRVLSLEEGNLLRDSISEQPFWESYVQGSNRGAFKAFRRRIDATTEFYMALEKRATEPNLSPEAKADLKEELRVLAAELDKPESDIAPGQVMTEEAYTAELNAIDTEMKTLLKTLTQQAMDRAKLQRVEIPFTVGQSN